MELVKLGRRMRAHKDTLDYATCYGLEVKPGLAIEVGAAWVWRKVRHGWVVTDEQVWEVMHHVHV